MACCSAAGSTSGAPQMRMSSGTPIFASRSSGRISFSRSMFSLAPSHSVRKSMRRSLVLAGT
eukprot:1976362-Prorocentrum_lima.AAC.1